MSNAMKHIEVYEKSMNLRISTDMKKKVVDLAKKSKRKPSDYTRLLFQFAIDNSLEL